MSEHWVPVARSSDVTTVPRPVEVAGRSGWGRTELHVRADRLGVALRRELSRFVTRRDDR